MELEPRTLHIGRAQRLLAAVGIELAGAITTQFVAELLGAVDEDRAGLESRVLVDRLLEGRPGRVVELVADEPLMGGDPGDARDAEEALHRFGARIVAFQREHRWSLDPRPLPPEIRRRIVATAVEDARSPDPEQRLRAVGAVTIARGEDGLLAALAADPDPRVSREARRELDRRAST